MRSIPHASCTMRSESTRPRRVPRRRRFCGVFLLGKGLYRVNAVVDAANLGLSLFVAAVGLYDLTRSPRPWLCDSGPRRSRTRGSERTRSI